MNTAEILEHAFDDGVTMTLTPTGTVKVRGDGAAVNRWLHLIREKKPDIVAALQEFERLLVRVGPAYGTPPEEYPLIREAAAKDIDAALQSYRAMAEELSEAKHQVPEEIKLPAMNQINQRRRLL